MSKNIYDYYKEQSQEPVIDSNLISAEDWLLLENYRRAERKKELHRQIMQAIEEYGLYNEMGV